MTTDSKALTPQQSFEEKVKSKLRDNIGDLMPDEVLADMVKKAMNEMFFTRRERKPESWSSRTEILPSWFEDEVATALKQRVLDEVKVAVAAKQDAIREVAAKLVTEKLPDFIASALIGLVSHMTLNSSYTAQAQVLDMLRQKGFNV